MVLTPAALTLRHAPIADCARYDNLRRIIYGTIRYRYYVSSDFLRIRTGLRGNATGLWATLHANFGYWKPSQQRHASGFEAFRRETAEVPRQRPDVWRLTSGNGGTSVGTRNSQGETRVAGWGARIRTWEWRNQNRTVSERILSREAPAPSSGMAYG
jgi:hypothetical protein